MFAQSFCNRTVILITDISLYQAKSVYLKCPITEENAPHRRLTKGIVRVREVKCKKGFFYSLPHSKGMFPSLFFFFFETSVVIRVQNFGQGVGMGSWTEAGFWVVSASQIRVAAYLFSHFSTFQTVFSSFKLASFQCFLGSRNKDVFPLPRLFLFPVYLFLPFCQSKDGSDCF